MPRCYGYNNWNLWLIREFKWAGGVILSIHQTTLWLFFSNEPCISRLYYFTTAQYTIHILKAVYEWKWYFVKLAPHTQKVDNASIILGLTAAHCSHEALPLKSVSSVIGQRRRGSSWVFLWGSHWKRSANIN